MRTDDAIRLRHMLDAIERVKNRMRNDKTLRELIEEIENKLGKSQRQTLFAFYHLQAA